MTPKQSRQAKPARPSDDEARVRNDLAVWHEDACRLLSRYRIADQDGRPVDAAEDRPFRTKFAESQLSTIPAALQAAERGDLWLAMRLAIHAAQSSEINRHAETVTLLSKQLDILQPFQQARKGRRGSGKKRRGKLKPMKRYPHEGASVSDRELLEREYAQILKEQEGKRRPKKPGEILRGMASARGVSRDTIERRAPSLVPSYRKAGK